MQTMTNGKVVLPAANDLEATWKFLHEGIEVMMNQLTEGMEYPRYMNLYTVAYNYCATSRMQSSGGGLAFSGKAGANLEGEELYERLKQYFRAHAEHIWQVCNTPGVI